ncbi:IS110 family transposase [Candidatus Poriferisodalis sp.]|uniref:IS110 family transposase n=1 Tax=Candidatus Poriferisodalis sp. TaxID=3101277 RepID=UPI003C6F5338
MADQPVGVYGGVDTHKEVHVAAATDQAGRVLATASFGADPAGYRRLAEWLGSFGPLVRVGVEGTGSYGAGLTRHLVGSGVEVAEVNRPNRQMRRRRGKSDVVDAEAAARAALAGDATTAPKGSDGIVESIRAIRVALCSTRAHRTRVSNQIRDLVVTAPDRLRSALEPLTTAQRVARCARFRPGDPAEPAEAAKIALRTLARQHQVLDADLDELRRHLDELTLTANPALRAAKGIGTDTASILLITAGDNPERLTGEASFAALCGASPIEASSGKTTRHRLNPGGNRQANHALWRIAMVRLATCPRTRAYAQRRQTEGKSRREIIRCLKRYIAREVFALLAHPHHANSAGDPGELRHRRQAAGLSLAHAADQLNTWPATISMIERGKAPHHALVPAYRDWLNTLQPAA